MVNVKKSDVKKIVKLLKKFDGKYTNFLDIRDVVLKNDISIINSGIRKILYSLERIGVVRIGKALTGHLTLYKNIPIEDYYFNFRNVYNTIENIIRSDPKLSMMMYPNGVDIIVVDDKLYFNPLNDFDFLMMWMDSYIPTVNVKFDDFMSYIKKERIEDIIVEMMFTDHKKYIYDKLKEYYWVRKNDKDEDR